MPKIFTTLDKIKPAYDMTEKIVMLICKLLLVADILITSYAVLGRFCQQWSREYEFLSFLHIIKDPSWTEEIVLTCMSYMAVLAAALAIRKGAHIRMTAFDGILPKPVVKALDILADVAVMALGVIMVKEGWVYAYTLMERGTFYVSITWLSRFWMYFPVPLAGVAMIVFELEALYNHIKSFFIKEEEATA
ncbi:MAG: TRAP transporter small permease subunit [Oscillospiraceae bacterium]|nr:TRAP transporter small permease subunit [Oscillospiraceae bacterium]